MLLRPEWIEFCSRFPDEEEAYHTPAQLDAIIDSWGARGAEIIHLGTSKEGKDIRAAVIGSGEKTLLAWGYPHPDEPLGAETLCWLGEALLSENLSLDWRVVLILCADPDEASRQRWFAGPRDALTFCQGAWRPSKLDWMVDYGFPLDWGPFWQMADAEGACRTERECLERCGPGGCTYAGWPHAPLPESQALARAIDLFHPEIVASMHNTHTGGDYTFLLQKERRAVLRELIEIPGIFGQARHLGEPIDRGRRWFADAPDLIHEPNLAHFQRRLERQEGYDPELAYRGNHSAAAYLEAKGWGAQFVCPETTQFRHPDFGDTSQLGIEEEVLCSVEDRRKGRYEVVRIRDHGKWLVAEQRPTRKRRREGHIEVCPLTRGMLGVRALARRRRVLHATDRLWASLTSQESELLWHPYVEERKLLRTPGAFVHDHSQLIFRTRPDYGHPATRAQAASLKWLWPMHTATLLGNFQNYLQVLPEDAATDTVRKKLDGLQKREISATPKSMRQESPRGPALASILARVLLLVQARS